ncbi:MAG: D-2-hydroxyacid dehydrogenase [Acidobacteria bacterium]|nr:MAG: D-2-hydroxyacid dehydrogenase [Acidobacteriota bacterium]
MPGKRLSRRAFVAAAGAVQAAGQTGSRQPVVVAPQIQSQIQAQADPIRVVTMYKFEPDEVEKLKRAVPNARVDVTVCSSRDEFRQKLREAEVVYESLRGDDLDYAPKLRWLQAGGAGMEGMDPKLRQSPLVVTNMARVFAHGISETAFALLLSLTRGITKYYYPQFAKRQMKPVGTVKSDHHTELVGRTMGIVGMGGIGSMIARRAYYGFDMRVVATDAKPIPKPEYVAELHDPTWFPAMAPQVDVLVAAAPHTPSTERMFNEQVFRGMKKTAYFLAMSRGKLFDDMALVKALKEGWIAGAGLDVFPQEPPPSNHPIFDCDNVVMTAHTSGWSPDRQVRLIDLFAENLRRYAIGQPLLNVVDKKAGY